MILFAKRPPYSMSQTNGSRIVTRHRVPISSTGGRKIRSFRRTEIWKSHRWKSHGHARAEVAPDCSRAVTVLLCQSRKTRLIEEVKLLSVVDETRSLCGSPR